MRTRLLVMAVGLATWTGLGSTALAHGGHEHGGGERNSVRKSATLSFDLSGAQVPDGGDPTGRGDATLRLYSDKDLACLRAAWRDLAGEVTAIHVHRGAEGQTGPHQIEILNEESLAGDANRVELCVKVTGGHHGADGDGLQDVIDDPAGFYLSIHSTAFPTGAIRGQLN